MLTIQGTEVTVGDLLNAVAKLTPADQARFERGFLALRQHQLLKEKVACSAKSYQLSSEQQKRLKVLLDKNKEGEIKPNEGRELDDLLNELDRRNMLLADGIEKLASQ